VAPFLALAVFLAGLCGRVVPSIIGLLPTTQPPQRFIV
jgi:hypothetical protein